MGMDRRKFVKAAGLTAFGLAAGKPLEVLSSEAVKETDSGCVGCEGICGEVQRAEQPPALAKRWAMVIDLRVCRENPDCNACIDACHLKHNVPSYPDKKDEIKWIWKEHFSHSFPDADHAFLNEHVKHSNALLLCNHCDNPPCVSVCPTKATWKREKDSLIMMDWHRCIGCRYCIAACPYGSRSFNYREPKKFFTEQGIEPQPDFPTRTRGVVEKCTFCEERLARGQWPSCVEACPHNAMCFGDIDNPGDPVRKILEKNFSIRRKPALGTQPQVYYIL